MIKLTKITLNKLVDTPVVGDKKPSHNLVASDEKYENKTSVGSFWFKSGANGNFLSGEMKKARSFEGKEYDGYVIITEKEWDEYQSLKASNTSTVAGKGYDGSVASTEEIDF